MASLEALNSKMNCQFYVKFSHMKYSYLYFCELKFSALTFCNFFLKTVGNKSSLKITFNDHYFLLGEHRNMVFILF